MSLQVLETAEAHGKAHGGSVTSGTSRGGGGGAASSMDGRSGGILSSMTGFTTRDADQAGTSGFGSVRSRLSKARAAQ